MQNENLQRNVEQLQATVTELQQFRVQFMNAKGQIQNLESQVGNFQNQIQQLTAQLTQLQERYNELMIRASQAGNFDQCNDERNSLRTQVSQMNVTVSELQSKLLMIGQKGTFGNTEPGLNFDGTKKLRVGSSFNGNDFA